MGDRYLTDLADVVRAAGLSVNEVEGWQTRARSSGGYASGLPSHVMCHHTASGEGSDGWPDANYLATGSDIAPVSNLYLDRLGQVWVIAAGATNTNGSGSDWWGGGVPSDSMNTHAIGIEAGNGGTGEPWPEVQQDAYLELVEALQAAYGIPTNQVRHHAEWAPDRKVDCAGPSWWADAGSWNYDDFRGSLHTTPIPPPGEDDDMAYGPYLIQDVNGSGVYATDRQFMTIRKLRDETALAGYRWQLRNAGARSAYANELEDGGQIMAVNDLNAFGEIIG